MKIVLAGQLNRAYSNAVASGASNSDGVRTGTARSPQGARERFLVQHALTLAALSCSIVSSPDAGVGADPDIPALERGQDPYFAPGMSLPPSLWADLCDDAAGLVKAVDFLGTYSEPSQAVMNAIAAPGAWIDDDGPFSIRRSKMGTTHAYLTDLLLQAFLAWQARAILVLCEADCHVLADIARFLVEGNRPRPFPIPDLRAIVRRDGRGAHCKLPNLQLECLADVEAAREDVGVQALTRRLQTISTGSEPSGNYGFASAALEEARSTGTQFQNTDDFTAFFDRAKVLSNEGVQVALNRKALARMALRRFGCYDLPLLVLLD